MRWFKQAQFSIEFTQNELLINVGSFDAAWVYGSCFALLRNEYKKSTQQNVKEWQNITIKNVRRFVCFFFFQIEM